MSDVRPLLLDTANRIFSEAFERARHARAVEAPFDPVLWSALADAGLAWALHDEGAGGSALSAGDAFAVLGAQGKHAGAAPLAETYLAAWTLQRAGLAAPVTTMTVAIADGPELTLSKTGAGWRVRGAAARTPWARDAAHIVVVSEEAIVLVPRGDVQIGANLAGESRDGVRWDVTLPAHAGAPSRSAASALLIMGAAARAVQLAGACERVLALSVTYAGDRKQFGKALGQFQAVQQMLAVMAGQAAAATAAADLVLDAIDAGEPDEFAVGAAKVRCGEAASAVAALAHQVHGAIGVTQEHALNLFTRRLWSWRDEFGSEAFWSVRIGRRVCRAGADALWPLITTAP